MYIIISMIILDDENDPCNENNKRTNYRPHPQITKKNLIIMVYSHSVYSNVYLQ